MPEFDTPGTRIAVDLLIINSWKIGDGTATDGLALQRLVGGDYIRVGTFSRSHGTDTASSVQVEWLCSPEAEKTIRMV